MGFKFATILGLFLIGNGLAGGVAGDTLAEVSPPNILVNPSFEQGSGNGAAAWESVLRGYAQTFVAGADKAHTGSRCIATRGTFTGPGTVNGWYLSGSTVEIVNPVGNGTTEGLTVAAGENCLKITDDPGVSSNSTCARTWVTRTTIKANCTYTLRFSYGKSSDPAKTWTQMGVYFAACPTVGSFANCIVFANPSPLSWSGGPGWKTYEYSDTVLAGDPRIGMNVGLQLEGHTVDVTDAYYFDKVEITETPIDMGNTGPPNAITFQGELMNAQGVSIVDASHDFVFKFYSQAAGGQPMWSSSTISITPNSSVFTAQIANIPSETVFANTDVWVEVVVGNETLSPRIKVDWAAHALIARLTTN